jgi:hypothetical protein
MIELAAAQERDQPDLRSTLRKAIETDGYIVVDAGHVADPLVVLSGLLGVRQCHARSDAHGIVGDTTSYMDASWREYQSEYRGVGNAEFEFHTDGSFIYGPGLDRPILVLLHCVEPAQQGGVNLLLDIQSIYDEVASEQPLMQHELSLPQFTFCRDNLLAANVPVFARYDSSKVGIRWRFDPAVYGPESALKVMRAFHREYIVNSQPVEVHLRANQVLVLDNIRMLHARTEATGSRRMRRTWIADPLVARTRNLSERSDTPRALRPLDSYLPLADGAAPSSENDSFVGIIPRP